MTDEHSDLRSKIELFVSSNKTISHLIYVEADNRIDGFLWFPLSQVFKTVMYVDVMIINV